MTKKEIIEQIAKYDKGMNNPNIPEAAKKTMRSKIEGLKKDLEKMEESSKAKEEKIVKEEKKVQEDLSETIAKLEKGMKNPNIPESAKKQLQKKIDSAKEELDKQKVELKNEQKEAKKETEEIKEAVKKIEKKIKSKPVKEKDSKEKKPAPAPRKETPIPVPKIKEKEREEKSKKRKNKISEILSDLEKLISKNKKLAFYKDSHVNLEIDAKRSAKPVGYRFRGKHDYRVPTKEEVVRGLKRGTVYKESRPERSDRYPKGYRGKIKLAHGGSIDAERFAKPSGWRWKDSAVTDGIVSRAALSKSPSAAMRAKYPDYVAYEDRKTKSDKHPSRKYRSLAHGGDVKHKDSKGEFGTFLIQIYQNGILKHEELVKAGYKKYVQEMAEEEAKKYKNPTIRIGKVMAKGGEVHHDQHLDGERTAKPQGWRWKDDAVHVGVIKKAALLKEPSDKMIEMYPELVYQEKRLSKSDKNPSSKFISLKKGGTTKAKKPANSHTNKLKEVMAHAKATRKEGEVWKMAVKRSWEEIG